MGLSFPSVSDPIDQITDENSTRQAVLINDKLALLDRGVDHLALQAKHFGRSTWRNSNRKQRHDATRCHSKALGRTRVGGVCWSMLGTGRVSPHGELSAEL
jgi:hypothetical protein